MKSFRRLYEEIKNQRITERKSPRKSFKQFIADQADNEANGSRRNLTKNEIRSAIKSVMIKRLRTQ